MKTSTFQNGLIWFGAGVSLAEILTGTSFAPLGMAKGFAAILIGHIIGCAHDAAGGPHRRPHRPQRHGDRQDELWPEGRPAVCLFERAAAGGLDGHHDLRRRTGCGRHFRHWPLGLVPGHRRTDYSVDCRGHHRPGLDQQDHDGRAVYPHAGAVQGHLLFRQCDARCGR